MWGWLTRYTVLVVLVAAGLVSGAQASNPRRELVARGDVEASLAYLQGKDEIGLPVIEDLRLSIIRRGESVISERPVAPPCSSCDVVPQRATGRRPSLLVLDLDGDREQEVVFVFWTGGAHCCTHTYIYDYAPRQQTYRRVNGNWAESYRLTRLDQNRIPEFVSSDNRFDYTFASHASSAEPIQIWHLRKGRLQDVTRRFRHQIAVNEQFHWRRYLRERKRGGEVRGLLAAYLADTYLLGKHRLGWDNLLTAYANRDLQGSDPGLPSASAYLRHLCAFLVRTDYSPSKRTCPSMDRETRPPVRRKPPPPPPPPTRPSRCDPSYPDFCIPPPPPDLDCDDVNGINFTVRGSDPHDFDRDGNGIGCEQ